MSRQGMRPSVVGALAFWAGADHYSLRKALTLQPFEFPSDRVAKIYRVEFNPLFAKKGVTHPRFLFRYLVHYQSATGRDCLVVLDELPADLRQRECSNLHPVEALQVFFKLVLREPSAFLSLLMIILANFFAMLLLLAWVNLILPNQFVLAIFSNESCDSGCVHKVMKIHSYCGLLFFTPIPLLFIPLLLMIFKAPRYRAAINYRFAQTYSTVAVALGVYLLVNLMVFFPFKNYGKFLMSGFGPNAERFLDAHGLNKK